jgi:predicted ATP-dependent protease
MIFRLFKQEKAAPATAVEVEATVDAAGDDIARLDLAATGEPARAVPVGRLAAADLRRCVASEASFAGTADLEPLGLAAEHEPAVLALEHALAHDGEPAGAFVLTPPEAPLAAAVIERLEALAKTWPLPSDWLYVADLSSERRLKALSLEAGRGADLVRGWADHGAALCETVAAALLREEYILRRDVIAEEARLSGDDQLESLRAKARAQNIALLDTPAGFVVAPMHEGKVVKPELFGQLPASMQREVEQRIAGLEGELATAIGEMARSELETARRLAMFAEETVRPRVKAAFATLREAFSGNVAVVAHLAEMEDDLCRHLVASASGAGRKPTRRRRSTSGRYRIEPLVLHDPAKETGAPIIAALRLSRERLTGVLVDGPDGMPSVMPGLLHAANGGILIVDARELLAAPEAWMELREAMRSRVIAIASSPSQGVRPQAIPLSLGLVVWGDRQLFERLVSLDGEAARVLPIVADLSAPIVRTASTEREMARLIAGEVHDLDGLPLDAEATAMLVEVCARLAPDRDKLLPGAGRMTTLVGEASRRARREGRASVTRDDVLSAMADRAGRQRRAAAASLAGQPPLAEVMKPAVGRVTTVAIDRVGDGLACRAGTVSATMRAGNGRPEDIVRAMAGSGLLDAAVSAQHWCHLAGRLPPEAQLSLAAVVSLDPLLGVTDLASCAAAELVALLSAAARIPVRPDLAVIGGVDPYGALLTVPEVNERIEGFHAVATARPGAGPAGVVIPHANVAQLMLSERVVSAVEAGAFAVHAVETVGQALAAVADLGSEADADGISAAKIDERVSAALAALASASSTTRKVSLAAMARGTAQ